MQRLPAERKKQTLKVSEFQSRYIVSSKIWREIFSRWFDVLCTGSFCRLRKVYKIYFVQTENDFPIDYHGIWQHIEHRYRDIGAFKIYVSDTGRLCAKSLRVYMDTYHPA